MEKKDEKNIDKYKLIKLIITSAVTFVSLNYIYKIIKYNLSVPSLTNNTINYDELKIGDLLFFSDKGLLEKTVKIMTDSFFNHVGVYVGNGLYWHLTLKEENVLSYISSKNVCYVRPFKYNLEENDIITPLIIQSNDKINKNFVKIWYENKIKSLIELKKKLIKKHNTYIDKKTRGEKNLTCAEFVCRFYKLLNFKIEEKSLPCDLIDSNNHLFYPICKLTFNK